MAKPPPSLPVVGTGFGPPERPAAGFLARHVLIFALMLSQAVGVRFDSANLDDHFLLPNRTLLSLCRYKSTLSSWWETKIRIYLGDFMSRQEGENLHRSFVLEQTRP